MNELFIIGDVAGQYDALLRLLARAPKNCQAVFVGDLIDRGPKSFEVLTHVMKNPQYICLLGNHEHMMLDAITNGGYYDPHAWVWNGGNKTIESFEINNIDLFRTEDQRLYVGWLESLPYQYLSSNVLISHAFWGSWMGEWGVSPNNYLQYNIEGSIIWNRLPPEPIAGKYQVCGHNSQFGLKTWYDEDGEPYATCLDDSRNKVLTGMHWPSLEIFQEPY